MRAGEAVETGAWLEAKQGPTLMSRPVALPAHCRQLQTFIFPYSPPGIVLGIRNRRSYLFLNHFSSRALCAVRSSLDGPLEGCAGKFDSCGCWGGSRGLFFGSLKFPVDSSYLYPLSHGMWVLEILVFVCTLAISVRDITFRALFSGVVRLLKKYEISQWP